MLTYLHESWQYLPRIAVLGSGQDLTAAVLAAILYENYLYKLHLLMFGGTKPIRKPLREKKT